MNKLVISMAVIRLISGSIEISAALLMLRFNSVEKALLVNSGLALFGPLVLISTTTIGLVGIADKISLGKLVWIISGLCLVFIGIFKK